MTVLAVFSYGLIAYGPAAALFFVTVARQPHEVIILIVGAFFWLLSVFCASLIRIAVPPLYSTTAFILPFSVILQEVFRWLFYRVIRRVDKLLSVMTDDKTMRRRHKVAYVGGLGFGAIAGVTTFSNVVRASAGPGIVGIDGGSQFFVMSSAFATNALIGLHACWGVLWFAGWDNKHWVKLVITFLSHMLIASLSLLNQYTGTTVWFLTTQYILLGLLIFYSLLAAGITRRELSILENAIRFCKVYFTFAPRSGTGSGASLPSSPPTPYSPLVQASTDSS